jgi:hypothetical protein
VRGESIAPGGSWRELPGGGSRRGLGCAGGGYSGVLAGERRGGLGMADVVVVGGGSAGCVLAARLSEDPGCEVTLLEDGPDLAGVADLPPDVVDASGPSLAHDWGYVAEPDRLGRCIALPRQDHRRMFGDQRVLRPAGGTG